MLSPARRATGAKSTTRLNPSPAVPAKQSRSRRRCPMVRRSWTAGILSFLAATQGANSIPRGEKLPGRARAIGEKLPNDAHPA
jgi:hypothetical protein